MRKSDDLHETVALATDKDIAQRDTQIEENHAQIAALQTELAQLRETVQRLFAKESLASAD